MSCPTCLNYKGRSCNSCYKTFAPFPSSPAPHEIPSLSHSFSIIVPTAGRNLIENPIPLPRGYGDGTSRGLFLNPNGGQGSTFVTNANSPVGGMALRIDPPLLPAAGVQQTLSVAQTVRFPQPGERVCFSIYFRAEPGSTFELGVENVGGPPLVTYASKVVTANGQWQREYVCYTAFGAERPVFYLRATAPTPPRAAFYVAGLQAEIIPPGAVDKASTFIYGSEGFDHPGFSQLPGGFPYSFEGLPNRSDSLRNRGTYAGGQQVSLADCGICVEGMTGWNMASGDRITQRYAQLDSSFYQDYKYTDSIATIVGRILRCDPSMQDLMCARECMRDAVTHPDRRCRDLQKMIYQPHDDCCVPCGEEMEIFGSYVSGLEGAIDNDGMQEQFVFSFERKPIIRSPMRRLEGVLTPTVVGQPNNQILAPDSVGQAVYQVAYCYQGEASSSPLWVFYAQRLNVAGATITNLDTGDVIQFNANPPILNNSYLIITTEPTSSRVFSYDPATNITTPLSGFLTPTSNISSFQFIKGYNNVQFNFPAADAITNQPNQPANVLQNAQPNNLITGWRENFYGLRGCCEQTPCDPEQVRPGYVPIIGDIETYPGATL